MFGWRLGCSCWPFLGDVETVGERWFGHCFFVVCVGGLVIGWFGNWSRFRVGVCGGMLVLVLRARIGGFGEDW